MKRLLALLCSLALVFCLLPSTAFAEGGNGNIDGGGGSMGQGTSSNFWNPGNDGVRITVVDADSGNAISSPIDFTNRSQNNVVHFGKVNKFALTIGQNLENDRDVLKILTSYRRVAGKDFGAELDQTIADMKTGNYENALIHFETRIGSPMLSDVIRGLIGVLRGDDQRMYFKMICFDMRQIEQNNLKKEAAKRPKKIQRYSMMMLICIMIIYLVVLCTEVMGSLGAFFG